MKRVVWLLVVGSLCVLGCKKKVDMTLPDSGTTTTTAASSSSTTASADSATPTPPSDDLAPLASLSPTKPPPPVVGVAKPHPSGSATPTAATPATGAPPECAAALVMQKAGRQKEYDTLKAACLAKGGKL